MLTKLSWGPTLCAAQWLSNRRNGERRRKERLMIQAWNYIKKRNFSRLFVSENPVINLVFFDNVVRHHRKGRALYSIISYYIILGFRVILRSNHLTVLNKHLVNDKGSLIKFLYWYQHICGYFNQLAQGVNRISLLFIQTGYRDFAERTRKELWLKDEEFV